MFEQFASMALKGLKLGGSIIQAKGWLDEGEYASDSALFAASQYRRRAGTWEASSQRAAEETRRRGMFMASRAQALAAASGGNALDLTVLKIMSGIAGETELAARTHLYQGIESRKTDEMAASAKEYEAKLAEKAAKGKAMSSILGGAGSLFSMFGSQDAPSSVTGSSGSDPWLGSFADWGMR